MLFRLTEDAKVLPAYQQNKNALGYLQLQLRKEGHNWYADRLKKGYRVRLTRAGLGGAPAAIDGNNVIYLRKDDFTNLITGKESFDKLSLLLRHELLHAFFSHIDREIEKYAKDLGYDINSLTDEQRDEIWDLMNYSSFTHNNYGGAGVGNFAADLDLARYYNDKDIKISLNELGGLVRDEFPQYAGLSYEDMIDAIKEEDKKLEYRVANKVYGHFDDEGNFIEDSEEEAEYASDHILDEDVFDVSIPTISEYNRSPLSNINHSDLWLSSLPEESNISLGGRYRSFDLGSASNIALIATKNNQISYQDSHKTAEVYPVFTILHSHHYNHIKEWADAIESPDEVYIGDLTIMYILGLPCMPITSDPERVATRLNKWISVQSIGSIPFASPGRDEDYDVSLLRAKLNTWYKKAKAGNLESI